MIKLELDSYKNSDAFRFIYFENEIIIRVFKEYINQGIELVAKKDKELIDNMNMIKDQNSIEYEHGRSIGEMRSYENYYLKQTFLKSGLIYLFTQLETALKNITERTAWFYEVNDIDYNIIKNKKQSQHDVLSTIKQQIKLLSKINISEHSSWSNLKDIQHIRNCVVHRNSIVKRNNDNPKAKILSDNLISIINRCEGLYYHESSNTLLIEKDFLINFSDIVSQFIDETLKKIYDSKKHR